MTITVVADHDTHLLISNGNRFAVIERRNNHFYNCHDDKRAGVLANDMSAVSQILDSDDWTDEQAARATFDAIVEQGTRLAQRML